MLRRRFLSVLGGTLGVIPLSGCAGLLPTGTDGNPMYPGGTLLIENTGGNSLDVAVTVVEDRFSASLSTTVPAEETVVKREFVTASEGEVATLRAQIGGEGEPTTFEFLPAGGTGDTPPEVARLSVKNSVEESATWTATEGTSR